MARRDNGGRSFDTSGNIGTVSLLAALQGNLTIKVRTSGAAATAAHGGAGDGGGGDGIGGGGATALNGAQCGEQVAGALLNAAVFGAIVTAPAMVVGALSSR